MAETTDKQTAAAAGWLPGLLLAVAIACVVGGLAAYYALTAQPTWVRIAALLAGLAVAAGVFAVSPLGRSFWEFAAGSRVELRKMVWPTKDETWKTTLVVFGFVALLGVFFWVVDALLNMATRKLLGGG